MGLKTLISILMPVKNTEDFLEDCLDSILQQEETSWELLVTDDHSTDHSFSILKKYAKKDSRIKVFKNEGQGIINALRTSYKNATGHFITRMDSDDKMASQKLKKLRLALENKGKGHIALGFVEYFSENALGEGYKKYADWLNQLSLNENNFSDIYKECVIPSPCWMIHKVDFEKCNAFHSDIYPEDYDLCFRFYKNDLKIISCKETLHYWRDHSSRASRNDPNYSDNRFTNIKVDYFLRIDHNKNKILFLWGAGKKGKKIAQKLIENKIAFRWVCNNPKKIGKDIYGIILEDENTILKTKSFQVIVSVSSPDENKKIRHKFKNNNDFYFFS